MSLKPVWPKEHGGWGLLFVPVVTGTFAHGTPGTAEVLFIVMTLAFYLSRPPLLSVLKRLQRSGSKSPADEIPGYLVLTMLAAFSIFTVLLFSFGYHLLPIIGMLAVLFLAANLALVMKKRTKEMTTELLAALGFSMGAPAAYYVSSGHIDRTAILLWLSNLLFLANMILYVRIRLSTLRFSETGRGDGGRPVVNGAYLAFLALSIGILLVANHTLRMNPVLLLAFLPSIVHSAFGILRMDGNLTPRRLGFGQLAQCVIFSILLVVLMRSVS